MARIRTIKPDFWRDEDLSTVSAEAALLAVGLLNHSDDEGFFNANPKLIESDVFPLRVLSSSVPVLLRELSGIGYISLYNGLDGKTYGQVSNFSKHQVINKATASKIKPLCDLQEHSRSDTVQLLSGKEGKGKEKEKEKKDSFDAIRHLMSLDVDEQIAKDWVKQRKTKPTLTAISGIEREANKARISMNQALTIACTRGWQSFKADWITDNKAQQLNGQQSAWLTITGQTLSNEVHHGRTIDSDPIPPALLGQ